MTHTPGPWKFECSETHPSSEYGQPPHFDPAFVVAGNQDIPVMRDDDARLIAAAPELLEACKAALAHIDEHGVADYIADAAVAEILRDAISKAEGAQ